MKKGTGSVTWQDDSIWTDRQTWILKYLCRYLYIHFSLFHMLRVLPVVFSGTIFDIFTQPCNEILVLGETRFFIHRIIRIYLVHMQSFFASKNLSPWSKGKHSWRCIWGRWVQISMTSTIFPMKKKWCVQDSSTWTLDQKSAMLDLRQWIHEK